MPQSLSQVILHIIFSTKNRERWLDDKIRTSLHAYAAGILRKHNAQAFKIGGTDDHIHIACTLPRTMNQAELVKILKTAMNEWIKSQSGNYSGFHWQRGYGSFSVSISVLDKVIDYIANQQKHHEEMSFQDEYRFLLTKHAVNYDENYVWD